MVTVKECHRQRNETLRLKNVISVLTSFSEIGKRVEKKSQRERKIHQFERICCEKNKCDQLFGERESNRFLRPHKMTNQFDDVRYCLLLTLSPFSLNQTQTDVLPCTFWYLLFVLGFTQEKISF